MNKKEYLITLKAKQILKQFSVKKIDFPSATSWAYQKRHYLTMGNQENWRIIAVKEN